eukprot:scaffold764_cov248-Pinguiococcus_pyrenoidosus.AAC.11
MLSTFSSALFVLLLSRRLGLRGRIPLSGDGPKGGVDTSSIAVSDAGRDVSSAEGADMSALPWRAASSSMPRMPLSNIIVAIVTRSARRESCLGRRSGPKDGFQAEAGEARRSIVSALSGPPGVPRSAAKPKLRRSGRAPELRGWTRGDARLTGLAVESGVCPLPRANERGCREAFGSATASAQEAHGRRRSRRARGSVTGATTTS